MCTSVAYSEHLQSAMIPESMSATAHRFYNRTLIKIQCRMWLDVASVEDLMSVEKHHIKSIAV